MTDRKVAVVTTFSKAGFHKYAERMLQSFKEHWPAEVDLFVYADEPNLPIPYAPNIHEVHGGIPQKEEFIRRYASEPKFTGFLQGQNIYNYRYDAIKFCHKPFALKHCMDTILLPEGYEAMVWLDADTLTHSPVLLKSVHKVIAPVSHPLQFLGRSYKYTECGYIYFDLTSGKAQLLLKRWVDFYTNGSFQHQKEWHDSWLFDEARRSLPPDFGNNLTGHLHRKNGAGHPMINSPLGRWFDHLKGDARKHTGKPRKGDLFIDHPDTQYWKENQHAKRTKPKPGRP